MPTIRARLSPPDGTFNSVDEAIRACDGVTRESLLAVDWLSDGSAVVLYRLGGRGPAAVEDVLADHDDVIAYDPTGDVDGGGYSVFVHVTPEEPMSELLALADRHALLIDRPLSFTADGIEVRVVGTESSLRGALADFPESIDARIESAGEYSPGAPTLLEEVTERQREAVETALELGYYETPRGATYEEIAAELDCAASTANELLRRAESRLVESAFGR